MVLIFNIDFSSLLSIDPQDKYGWTVAMRAIKFDQLDCLKCLVENKADLNAKVRGVFGVFGAGVVFDVWEEDTVENIRVTK